MATMHMESSRQARPTLPNPRPDSLLQKHRFLRHCLNFQRTCHPMEIMCEQHCLRKVRSDSIVEKSNPRTTYGTRIFGLASWGKPSVRVRALSTSVDEQIKFSAICRIRVSFRRNRELQHLMNCKPFLSSVRARTSAPPTSCSLFGILSKRNLATSLRQDSSKVVASPSRHRSIGNCNRSRKKL